MNPHGDIGLAKQKMWLYCASNPIYALYIGQE